MTPEQSDMIQKLKIFPENHEYLLCGGQVTETIIKFNPPTEIQMLKFLFYDNDCRNVGDAIYIGIKTHINREEHKTKSEWLATACLYVKQIESK